jgi:uncharacterized protein involved in cysteine biosynthesis
MIEAAFKSLAQMLTRPMRSILLKAIGLALLFIVLIGILLQRLFTWLAGAGAAWSEATIGYGPHALWEALVWFLSIAAGFGIVTGAVFLMPAVTAFVGSFFVDDIAEIVEREHYPAEPPGVALPLGRAMIEGVLTALLAALVYLFALPFVLFAGVGLVVLFLATSYLLGREYFDLVAMRFRPAAEAKALRRAHRLTIFIAGMFIAGFVSIPILNFATPLFATAFMVHMHKQLSGRRIELIEPARG